MNRTLFSTLANCVDEDQKNWASRFLIVLMAYRSSVYQSTGYNPQYLVCGQEFLYRSISCVHLASPPNRTAYKTGCCRNRTPRARGTSLLDAMLWLSNDIATVCTANADMLPHKKKAKTFYYTTPLFSRKNSRTFQSLAKPLLNFEMFKRRQLSNQWAWYR